MTKSSTVTATDMFCGAGGSSTGAVFAGAEIVLAMNHWKTAITTHNTNHPNTIHVCADIRESDPRRYPRTTILLASPECTNHSLAKGRVRKSVGQPTLFGSNAPDPSEERSRATMWDVPRFAEVHQYDCIIVENVVDIAHWVMFPAWLEAMRLLGYAFKPVFFNSMFAWPTPQNRDRFYGVFWRTGNRSPNLDFTPLAHCTKCEKDVHSIQSWKDPAKRWGRYGKHGQYLYRCPKCANAVTPYYFCAANAIDWSIAAPRIGDRKRAIAENTRHRVRAGLTKFRHNPFTVRDDISLVAPFMVEQHGTSTARAITDPLGCVLAGGGHHALAMPFLMNADHSSGVDCRIRGLDDPMQTQTARDQFGVVMPFLMGFISSYYGGSIQNQELSQAMGTLTSHEHHALVTMDDTITEDMIDDCGFRMLEPHEIQAAMAFPQSYQVTGNRRDKVRQLGNGVTPPVMEMLVRCCIESLERGAA